MFAELWYSAVKELIPYIKIVKLLGRCSPSDILVSTRRPDTLKRLSDLGVDVGFNNARVVFS